MTDPQTILFQDKLKFTIQFYNKSHYSTLTYTVQQYIDRDYNYSINLNCVKASSTKKNCNLFGYLQLGKQLCTADCLLIT